MRVDAVALVRGGGAEETGGRREREGLGGVGVEDVVEGAVKTKLRVCLCIESSIAWAKEVVSSWSGSS